MQIIAITNDHSEILAPDWLSKAEGVHRQLRPQLGEYSQSMREVFASGAEMAVAVKDSKVLGVTVFRLMVKTHCGRELYCDDLITDEAERSTGVGHALMTYMERVARERGCDVLTLDSGCQRHQAHKFYFREGMVIPSFHFSKDVE